MTLFVLLYTLDVVRNRYIFGLFLLLYFCAGLQAAPTISTLCTGIDNSSVVTLKEGEQTNLTITAWSKECEADACVAANKSCTAACTGCVLYDGDSAMNLYGVATNNSIIGGLTCSIMDSSDSGKWIASCLATNSLAGHTGLSLVLDMINTTTNTTIGTKLHNLTLIAGDIMIPKCIGTFENGTAKVYLGYDNMLMINLMDDWNNTVGANTGRLGVTPVPFTVTITWNPDDGSKVTLSQPATVDTRGDFGFYTANVSPTKVGNYLAKVGVNTTMILNSPIPFQAVKAKKGSANYLIPLLFGTGVKGLGLTVVYMAVVSAMAGNLI